MSRYKKSFGDKGEDLAVNYLKNLGYEIVTRNYRFGHGEIDIVAKDKDTLVFVEVKTRENFNFGPPELAVTKRKQHQIKKISEAYIHENNISGTECRIDVIAILMEKNKKPEINHIVNAF